VEELTLLPWKEYDGDIVPGGSSFKGFKSDAWSERCQPCVREADNSNIRMSFGFSIKYKEEARP